MSIFLVFLSFLRGILLWRHTSFLSRWLILEYAFHLIIVLTWERNGHNKNFWDILRPGVLLRESDRSHRLVSDTHILIVCMVYIYMYSVCVCVCVVCVYPGIRDSWVFLCYKSQWIGWLTTHHEIQDLIIVLAWERYGHNKNFETFWDQVSSSGSQTGHTVSSLMTVRNWKKKNHSYMTSFHSRSKNYNCSLVSRLDHLQSVVTRGSTTTHTSGYVSIRQDTSAYVSITAGTGRLLEPNLRFIMNRESES